MAIYLVTGCAGFIGWKVTEFLLADGHKVVGVDNLNDAYDVRLKHWRLDQIKDHPNFTFYRANICDPKTLREIFTQHAPRNTHHATRNTDSPFDAIINLAARAGVRQSVENPWVYYETNVTGTLNLLELCREFEVKHFVLASTSSLYGARNPRPFREDADTDGPLSPYAASKKAAETLCYTYHYLYDINVAVLRYFTVYGPAGRPDMSPFRFIQWISEGRPVVVYGDGSQSRDFTYVDDIARGTIAALNWLMTDRGRRTADDGRWKREGGGEDTLVGRSSSVFEIVNLGSGQPVVLMDVIRLMEDLVGKRARIEYRPRHPADVMATWADISKAERLLGWRPHVSFAEGVARLAAWYNTHRSWTRDIVTS